MKRSTVKSFVVGVIIGLSCLTIILMTGCMETFKATGNLISAFGDDVSSAATGIEKQIADNQQDN